MVEAGYQKLLSRVEERNNELRALCAELFESKSEIVLEIGCGHGDYLNAYAQANPNEFCVGIDIIGKRIHKSDKKKNRFGAENLAFVKAEAKEFVEALPKHLQLSKIFVLFPDPWPKQRHHRRRLIQAEFLQDLADRASPQAKFYFRTDHSGYFSAVERLLRDHPAWSINSDLAWPFEHRTFFQNVTYGHQSVAAEALDRG